MKIKKNTRLYAAFFVSLLFIFSGCQNSNIFSWAHDEGTGDFASLKSDADTALANGNYAKAKDYYQKALAKNPKDTDTVMGYCSATFALAAHGMLPTFFNAVVNASGSQNALMSISAADRQKLLTVLGEILQSDKLPAIVTVQGEGSTDRNLNAAIAYLLYGILNVLNDPVILQYIEISSNFDISNIGGVSLDSAQMQQILNKFNSTLNTLQAASDCLSRITADSSLVSTLSTNIKNIKKALGV